MVLVKFTNKSIVECEEMELAKALQIQEYCRRKKYKCDIIEDPEKIKILKEFFGNNNNVFSFSTDPKYLKICIKSINENLHKETYAKKLKNVVLFNKKYTKVVTHLIKDYKASSGNILDNSLEIKQNIIDNFLGCIYLVNLGYNHDVSSIIAGYLDANKFKESLYDIHPELYKYLGNDQKLDVYEDPGLPDYHITTQHNIIIRKHNNEFIVCGKLKNDNIIEIDVSDHNFINSIGLKYNKNDKSELRLAQNNFCTVKINVYVHKKLPGYYVTDQSDFIFKVYNNNEFIVYGKIKDNIVVEIETSDYKFLDAHLFKYKNIDGSELTKIKNLYNK